jgi:hypothetical protein
MLSAIAASGPMKAVLGYMLAGQYKGNTRLLRQPLFVAVAVRFESGHPLPIDNSRVFNIDIQCRRR